MTKGTRRTGWSTALTLHHALNSTEVTVGYDHRFTVLKELGDDPSRPVW